MKAENGVDASSAKNNDKLFDLSINKFKPISDSEHAYEIKGYWFDLRITKIAETDIGKFIVGWEKNFKSSGGGVVDPKSLLKTENATISGLPAKKLSFDGGNMILTSIKVIKNSYLYELDFNAYPDIRQSENDTATARKSFDQFVSSFKFTK